MLIPYDWVNDKNGFKLIWTVYKLYLQWQDCLCEVCSVYCTSHDRKVNEQNIAFDKTLHCSRTWHQYKHMRVGTVLQSCTKWLVNTSSLNNSTCIIQIKNSLKCPKKKEVKITSAIITNIQNKYLSIYMYVNEHL